MRLKVTLLISVLSGLLSACGSDNGSNGVVDSVGESRQSEVTTQLGLFWVFQSDREVSAQGLFYESENIESFISSGELFTLFNGASIIENDQCDMNVVNDSEIEDIPIVGGPSELISAGEVLTLSGAAGTYGTLEANVGPLSLFYFPESGLSYPMPQNLVVDIPGDQFPAFSAVSIPAASALDIVPGFLDVVNADTTFRWTGSSDPNSAVGITASFAINESNLIVRCKVIDDGEFAFPENVKSRTGQENASFVDYERTSVNSVVVGSSRLFTINEWSSQ